MKVGYRGSLLSIAQAGLVQQRYATSWQQVIVQTEGDKDQKTPIAEMGGKAVFCSTIEKELLDGRIDVAIHSYKDMPGISTPGLVVNVVMPRNNCYDYLLGNIKYDSEQSPVVGTSSPRRKAQIIKLFPWVEVKDIRGNVNTRIEKLQRGDYDAIVLAGAGLDLLNINVDKRLLDIVPAICQGIIALQTRIDDTKTNNAIAHINDPDTYYNAQVERALLERIGGDCHTALAGNVHYDYLNAEMFLDGKHTGKLQSRKDSYKTPQAWGSAMGDLLLSLL